MRRAFLSLPLLLLATATACSEGPAHALEPDAGLADVMVRNNLRWHFSGGGVHSQAHWEGDRPPRVLFAADGGLTEVSGQRTDAGDFVFPGVPAGPYFVHMLRSEGDFSRVLKDEYVLTTERTVDFSQDVSGRPDLEWRKWPERPVVSFEASGLEPIYDTISSAGSPSLRFMQLSSTPPDAVVYAYMPSGAEGKTRVRFPQDAPAHAYSEWPLLDAARGDEVWLVQSNHRRLQPLPESPPLQRAFGYSTLTRALKLQTPPQYDGGSSLELGHYALQDPSESAVSVDWRVLHFHQQSREAHRNATPLREELTASVRIHGGSALDVFVLRESFSLRENVQGGARIANPFPSDWPVLARASHRYFVGAPYGKDSCPVPFELAVQDRPAALFAQPIAPRIGPVRGLSLDGVDIHAKATIGASALPLLSWNPPALGTPGAYRVRVRKLCEKDSALTVRGDVTSVRLPDGMLEAGGQYVIAVDSVLTEMPAPEA